MFLKVQSQSWLEFWVVTIWIIRLSKQQIPSCNISEIPSKGPGNIRQLVPISVRSEQIKDRFFLITNTEEAGNIRRGEESQEVDDAIKHAIKNNVDTVNELLSRDIKHSCRIKTSTSTCIAFKIKPPRNDETRDDYLGIFKIHQDEDGIEIETEHEDNVCGYGTFLFGEEEGHVDDDWSLHFCDIRARNAYILKPDTDYYLTYDASLMRNAQQDLRVYFALPIMASEEISIECGIKMPSRDSPENLNNTDEENAKPTSKSTLRTELIGIVIAALCLTLLTVAMIMFMCVRWRRKKKLADQKTPSAPPTQPIAQTAPVIVRQNTYQDQRPPMVAARPGEYPTENDAENPYMVIPASYVNTQLPDTNNYTELSSPDQLNNEAAVQYMEIPADGPSQTDTVNPSKYAYISLDHENIATPSNIPTSQEENSDSPDRHLPKVQPADNNLVDNDVYSITSEDSNRSDTEYPPNVTRVNEYLELIDDTETGLKRHDSVTMMTDNNAYET